tara:strand:+ start:2064 stop:2921 length:858 start_codon:yes stop_codon:yes gene_type:complete
MKYKSPINMLKTPWVESPFFYDILKKEKVSSDYKKLASYFHENGYVILDLNLSNKFINNINKDIENKIKEGSFKKNPDIYHYNDSPRIVEAWKYSKNVLKLARHPKILNFLNFLYKKKPLPFSTINFIKGTEQPLHSDYIHFSSIPEKYLVGVWIALENTNKFNGPLAVSPKSHKLDILNYEDLGLKLPTNIVELDKCYKVYEDFVRKIIKSQKLKVKELYVKKGQAIFWAANMLHGGMKLKKPELTRKSQVIHYHFEECEKYYNPGFSSPRRGIYVERKLEKVS